MRYYAYFRTRILSSVFWGRIGIFDDWWESFEGAFGVWNRQGSHYCVNNKQLSAGEAGARPSIGGSARDALPKPDDWPQSATRWSIRGKNHTRGLRRQYGCHFFVLHIANDVILGDCPRFRSVEISGGTYFTSFGRFALRAKMSTHKDLASK